MAFKVLAVLVLVPLQILVFVLRYLFRHDGPTEQRQLRAPSSAPSSEPPRPRPAPSESAPTGQYVGPAYVAGVSASSECQVCGNPLTAAVVSCKDCGTLHHEDCWSYGGGCSTYGCRSRAS